MRKRILQFIPSFHQGGSERQAISLVRSLHAMGTFEVFTAALNKEGVLLPEFRRIGLPDPPEFCLYSFYSRNFLTQVRRCAAFLRDNKIDLVHTHDFYSNIFGMAAATLARTPVKIASKRETSQMRSGSQNAVEKLAFGRADRVVANCVAVRDYLVARAVPPLKIEVIYNGVSLDRFSTPQPESPSVVGMRYGLPDDGSAVFVTMVANLRHPVKNVPMLLRVARRLAESHPQVHFVIAGEGGLAAELKSAAVGLGVAKRVHFIGRCDDVPALLRLSTVCVLTSSAEGFSNSILEYMSAGKPVVATEVGGAAEAIRYGENGFYVPADDDERMASCLRRLLNEPETARSFGENGRQIVESTFSERANLERTASLYESCFEPRKAYSLAIKTC